MMIDIETFCSQFFPPHLSLSTRYEKNLILQSVPVFLVCESECACIKMDDEMMIKTKKKSLEKTKQNSRTNEESCFT